MKTINQENPAEKILPLILFSAKFGLSSHCATATAGHKTFYIICSIALESPPRNTASKTIVLLRVSTFSADFHI